MGATSAVWFLHFPKCGTSFHATVNSFNCPGAPRDCIYGSPGYICQNHNISLLDSATRIQFNCSTLFRPYSNGHTPAGHAPIQQAAAMFRTPSQRFLAAPFHDSDARLKAFSHGVEEEDKIATAARWPGRQGCMTKMLTGHLCWAPLNASDGEETIQSFLAARSLNNKVTARQLLDAHCIREQQRLDQLVPQAVDAIHSMAFVGKTDNWEASIALFHNKFVPSIRIASAQLFNMRPGDDTRHQSDMFSASLHDGRVLEGLWDAADERIYAEASARFSKEVAQALESGLMLQVKS